MKYASDTKSSIYISVFLAFSVVWALSLLQSATAFARPSTSPPALVITSEPLPLSLQSQIYNNPVQTPAIDPAAISGDSYFNSYRKTTLAGKKIQDLNNELFSMQGLIAALSGRLDSLESKGRFRAADYYASIATIRTQLQSGTTPGNPRLVKRLTTARENLEHLSNNISGLNGLAVEIANITSMASFLLESARATYSLSGAIEEDHVRLARLEDSINNAVVVIDRLLNNVNDDITRTMTYVSTERVNLRTLSLAVTTGDLFGRSLSNRSFSMLQRSSFVPGSEKSAQASVPVGVVPAPVPVMGAASVPASFGAPVAAQKTRSPASARPLVKIRFDHPNVAYEQPLYVAINEALQRFPDARFELIAVHPDQGNAAQVSIQSTRSRRNAERVLRSLVQMGLAMDRVDLSYAPSRTAASNEVHLYIR